MKLPKTVIAYILTAILSKSSPALLGIGLSIKLIAKRIAVGGLFIIFGILSASLTFIFAAITFFLSLSELTQYMSAALWTTGTLAIISILLFISGIRFISKK